MSLFIPNQRIALFSPAMTPQYGSRSVAIFSSKESNNSETTGIAPTPCFFIKAAAAWAVFHGLHETSSFVMNPLRASQFPLVPFDLPHSMTARSVRRVTFLRERDHNAQDVSRSGRIGTANIENLKKKMLVHRRRLQTAWDKFIQMASTDCKSPHTRSVKWADESHMSGLRVIRSSRLFPGAASLGIGSSGAFRRSAE